ncbi:MAG TPA: 4Fe-4S double cluster binding domain-containing protein [Deltaproteobacteria bacterium]|nr:4Fe-4S double cluster binding domain-containing protein [Deltaproteobacteria bacterium]
MISKEAIIEKAHALEFVDIGFTTAEPFEKQREILQDRSEEYGWVHRMGLDLTAGTDPENILPGARSIIVLLEAYFSKSFPTRMERHFGRCYLDDDRVTKDGLALRIKQFRAFLKDAGMEVKVPFHLPHRDAAARAGLGTFGKNTLFYAKRTVMQSSWVLPIALVVDAEFAPDEPDFSVRCPDWCRNACIAACPTGALKAPRKIDPRRCISYLSYFGEGTTPRDLREPMGMWIYGCDRCQNVCPRNTPWLTRDLPANEKVTARADAFDLRCLLHMDGDYYVSRVWPHMFYMGPDDLWRWKMNTARAMGNSRDPSYVPDLIRAYGENSDERVRIMAAWALGRIGGREAKGALDGFLSESDGTLREEIFYALQLCAQGD